MDKMNFAQAVTRIKALETKLLDGTKLNRMIESSTADEAIKVLSETEYSQFMGNVKRAEDYEYLLSEELKRVYSLIDEISPEKRLVDLLAIKYDYHNLKTLIKGKALKRDLSDLLVPVGNADIKILKDAVMNENYYDLSSIMREALENTIGDFEKTKDPQRIDIILDKYMYKEMHEIANELGDSYTIEYVKKNIDLTNILTFLRLKKQKKDREFLKTVILRRGSIDVDIYENYYNDSVDNFVNRISHTDYYDILSAGLEEYNKSGKLSTIEMLRDNFIMNYIKNAKYISFGIEPLIAYVYAKENEIKAIRIIMVGKLNNIEPEVIKGRLRDIYV